MTCFWLKKEIINKGINILLIYNYGSNITLKELLKQFAIDHFFINLKNMLIVSI